MRKLLLCLITCLSGCSTMIPVAPTRDLITISPDMVQECAFLKPFEGKTFGDSVRYNFDLIEAYKLCDAENHAKVELMRKIFGVKVQEKK